MVYITYNDQVNGIYYSQVIDTVKRLSKLSNKNIKIIAFFSLRIFFKERKKLKKACKSSIAIPMLPGIQNWKKNSFFLKFLLKDERAIIGRGIFATNLAHLAKKKGSKICYDGRGAIKAEFEEYNLGGGKIKVGEISILEKNAILNSDFRIAVSRALIKYWEYEYKYKDTKHTIIPCTTKNLDKDEITISRNKFDWKEDNIVLIYAGSIAGWQSFDNSNHPILDLLMGDSSNVALFLSPEHNFINEMKSKYGNRIQQLFVPPNEVSQYLEIGDYGLLLRSNSITNKVASPVKFAEYLAAGLKIIISNNIGDYSTLVKEENLGIVYDRSLSTNLKRTEKEEKVQIQKYCRENLTKNSHPIIDSYKRLITELLA